MQISGDNRAACELLGWQPRIGLDDGLRRTIAWYTAHRDMISAPTAVA